MDTIYSIKNKDINSIVEDTIIEIANGHRVRNNIKASIESLISTNLCFSNNNGYSNIADLFIIKESIKTIIKKDEVFFEIVRTKREIKEKLESIGSSMKLVYDKLNVYSILSLEAYFKNKETQNKDDYIDEFSRIMKESKDIEKTENAIIVNVIRSVESSDISKILDNVSNTRYVNYFYTLGLSEISFSKAKDSVLKECSGN